MEPVIEIDFNKYVIKDIKLDEPSIAIYSRYVNFLLKDNDEDTLPYSESELCGLPAAKTIQRIHPRSMNKG